jgi:hypothetical protein
MLCLRGCLRRFAEKIPQMAPHQYIASAPKVFERPSAQLRVSGGVLDVGVAQPKLQPSGVVTRIGQQVPAGVSQLMPLLSLNN